MKILIILLVFLGGCSSTVEIYECEDLVVLVNDKPPKYTAICKKELLDFWEKLE